MYYNEYNVRPVTYAQCSHDSRMGSLVGCVHLYMCCTGIVYHYDHDNSIVLYPS